jgi:hypothetical protein
MPTSASGWLFLGLFGIAWLIIAWRCLLPLQGRPAVPPKLPRLLKPRTPLDGPACCPSRPCPTLPAPVRAPVRPWCEIKSRRGAPKRIPTQGFACPMPTCPSDQITDAKVHAASRGRLTWQRRSHSDLSLSSLPHDFQRPSQHPALPPQNSRLPRRGSAHRAVRRLGCGSSWTGVWVSPGHDHRLADTRLASRARACISAPCSTSPSRISNWMNCAPACAAGRMFSGCGWRSTPEAAIIPVLQLGPRTQLLP